LLLHNYLIVWYLHKIIDYWYINTYTEFLYHTVLQINIPITLVCWIPFQVRFRNSRSSKLENSCFSGFERCRVCNGIRNSIRYSTSSWIVACTIYPCTRVVQISRFNANTYFRFGFPSPYAPPPPAFHFLTNEIIRSRSVCLTMWRI